MADDETRSERDEFQVHVATIYVFLLCFHSIFTASEDFPSNDCFEV